MSEPRVVGQTPQLPRLLAQSPWWTEPIRAERLAAVRIGTALVLLADIFCTYWPQAGDFYGAASLGSPEVFAGRLEGTLRWSLLAGVADRQVITAALAVWAVAGVCLLVGVYPRVAACIAWALAISFQNGNAYLHNSGDNVRQILLFYLMLSPCGAAWSLAAWRDKAKSGEQRPAFIPPWPVRLMAIQLAAIYFMNGIYKLMGADWRDGEIMHRVLTNVLWTRFSSEQLPLFPGATALMTWVTLVWELGFPAFLLWPKIRGPVLWLGVVFHLATAVLLTLGVFPFYMLCLYLPFVPWERWDLARVFAGGTPRIPRQAGIDRQAPSLNAAG